MTTKNYLFKLKHGVAIFQDPHHFTNPAVQTARDHFSQYKITALLLETISATYTFESSSHWDLTKSNARSLP